MTTRGRGIILHPEEPPAGPWRVERIIDAFARFARPRPVVVAIDGRSASGKTSLAARVAEAVPETAVVHTDDIAWFHSRFGWADLAVRVLESAHAGRPLSFRPPAWDERRRQGSIVLPGGLRLLLLEGVGSSREELAHLLDGRLWVQADRAATDRRGDDRIAAGTLTRRDAEEWLAEELPFLAARRPWEHADLVVAGTPSLPHDPRSEVVVADGPCGVLGARAGPDRLPGPAARDRRTGAAAGRSTPWRRDERLETPLPPDRAPS